MKPLPGTYKIFARLFALVGVLPLFQCSQTEPLTDYSRVPQYRSKEDNVVTEDDRPDDEIAIAGQKLGETSPGTIGPGSAQGGGTTPAGTPATPGPAAPASPPAPPPPPTPTHVVTVSCAGLMNFAVKFGTESPQISVTAPRACPQLATALNGKSFPTGKTTETPRGGATINAACEAGTLRLGIAETNGGSSTSISTGLELGNQTVCLEIRNVINGLKS